MWSNQQTNVVSFHRTGECPWYSCGPWNDTRTAYHNAVYLENWLQKFPEFGCNAWYIVGESYAGIYVPSCAAPPLHLC